MIKQIQSKFNKALISLKIKRLNKDLRNIAVEFVRNNKAIQNALLLQDRQKELKNKFIELKREITKLESNKC